MECSPLRILNPPFERKDSRYHRNSPFFLSVNKHRPWWLLSSFSLRAPAIAYGFRVEDFVLEWSRCIELDSLCPPLPESSCSAQSEDSRDPVIAQDTFSSPQSSPGRSHSSGRPSPAHAPTGVDETAVWHTTLEPVAPAAIPVPPAHQTMIEHSTVCPVPTSPPSSPPQITPLSLTKQNEDRPPVITHSVVFHEERTGAFQTVRPSKPMGPPHIPVVGPAVQMQSVITSLNPPLDKRVAPQASTSESEPICAPSHMVHRPTPTRVVGVPGPSNPSNVPPSQLIARSMRAGATLTGSFTRKPCPYCVNKSFPSYKDLERHLRTHTGERPYPCNLCDYRARQRGALRNHMSKKHGVQMPPLPPV